MWGLVALLIFMLATYAAKEFIFVPLNENYGPHATFILFVSFVVCAIVHAAIQERRGGALAKIGAIFLYLGAAFFIYFDNPGITILMIVGPGIVWLVRDWRSMSIKKKK